MNQSPPKWAVGCISEFVLSKINATNVEACGTRATAWCWRVPQTSGCSLCESVGSQISQQLVPDMLGILFYFHHNIPHTRQYRWLVFIVHIALQQLNYIDPVPRVHDESCKQHVQAIV